LSSFRLGKIMCPGPWLLDVFAEGRFVPGDARVFGQFVAHVKALLRARGWLARGAVGRGRSIGLAILMLSVVFPLELNGSAS
jgi:hypothetical protein